MDSRKHLSPEDWAHLEALCLKNIDTDRRNAIMLLFTMYTGMRAGELLATRWLDIDLKTQSVHINTLKKGKPREIPVPRKILNEVAKLRLGAMDDEKVFKIGYPRLVQIWNNYRPAKAKFHSLRHTFALSLYDKTKDIRLVMFSLGHRQVTTTMIYANYNYSIKELKKAMGVK